MYIYILDKCVFLIGRLSKEIIYVTVHKQDNLV